MAVPAQVGPGSPAPRRPRGPQAPHRSRPGWRGWARERAEGILPAPEPSHAIRVAIDEALEAREAREARVILFNVCGRGRSSLSAYERYLDGTLKDYEYPRERVEAALASLP